MDNLTLTHCFRNLKFTDNFFNNIEIELSNPTQSAAAAAAAAAAATKTTHE